MTSILVCQSTIATSGSANEGDTLDQKIAESVRRLDGLKHDGASKQTEIDQLQDKIDTVTTEEVATRQFQDGESPEAQRLRGLENNLDKANMKCQEAEHIASAYRAIIDKLQQERLSFDGKIVSLEQTIQSRKADIANLEVLLAVHSFHVLFL